jgi:hypothetical protein
MSGRRRTRAAFPEAGIVAPYRVAAHPDRLGPRSLQFRP